MREWALTKEAFGKLLARLDKDPERAQVKYQEIHRKLSRFFQARGCDDPLELADSTIDRVAKRIDTGLQIKADDPYVFFLGVAYRIFLEYLRRIRPVGLEDVSVSQMPRTDFYRDQQVLEDYNKKERRAQCIDQCLNNLSDEKRDLIIQYMRGEKRERINNRRRMEERLVITPNALSLRVYKIKNELKACFDECLKVISGEEQT